MTGKIINGGVPRITPWAVEVATSTNFANQYVGTPSFLIDTNGTYWASHNWFYGDSTPFDTTLIYKSTNQGGSWSLVRTISGLFWAKMFEYSGALFALGVHENNATTGGGNLVIFKTTDDWVSAPSSTTILSDLEYATHAAGTVIDSGYLLVPISSRINKNFASGFKLSMLWGDLTDLMQAGNWGITNQLAYDQAWNDPSWHATESGWLEPSIVYTGGTFKLLARHHNTFEHKGCLIDVTWTPATPTASLSFNDSTGFIDIPGGSVQFVPIWHATSSKWIIVCNHRSANIGNPSVERDEQYLYSTVSPYTVWTQVKQLHGQQFEKSLPQAGGITKDGFQYTVGQLSADDDTLHTLTRTAWRGANDYHDANRLTYDFIPNLNTLLA